MNIISHRLGRTISSGLLVGIGLAILAVMVVEVKGGENNTPDSLHARQSTISQPVPTQKLQTENDTIRWFHNGRLNILVIIFAFFLLVLLLTHKAKKGSVPLMREIPGMSTIVEAVEIASQAGKSVVYVPGVFDVDNIQTIASMAILVEVAKETARRGVRLIVPLNRAFLIPLAEESVKRGMNEVGKGDQFDSNDIQYLSDDQFAYAAAVDGIILREKPAAALYLGGFGAEALILAETGHIAGAVQIAGTAETQQLPFLVAACDQTLIGEEFYAAGAYISRDPKLLGTLQAADMVKAVIIAILLVGSILELLGLHPITSWFIVQ